MGVRFIFILFSQTSFFEVRLFFLNRLVGGHFCLQAPWDSVGFISCRFFKNMRNNIEKAVHHQGGRIVCAPNPRGSGCYEQPNFSRRQRRAKNKFPIDAPILRVEPGCCLPQAQSANRLWRHSTCLVMIGVISLIFQVVFQHKKEIAAQTLRKSAAIS